MSLRVVCLYGCLLAALAAALPAAAQVFNLPPPLDIRNIPPSLAVTFGTTAWADFNNDTYPDFLIFGRTPNETMLGQIHFSERLRLDDNLFGYRFTSRNSFTPTWMTDVALGDYDNDGDLDVLMAGATAPAPAFEPVTHIYRNVGDARFEQAFELDGRFGGAVAWADYDNDGDLDAFVTGADAQEQFSARLYRNDGGATFTAVEAGLEGVGYGGADWADYDGDGDLDLALSGLTNKDRFVTHVYRNDGGAFSLIPAPLPGLAYGDLAWVDYDSDGDADLAVTGGRLGPLLLEGTTRLYRNDGDGGFTEAGTELLGVLLSTMGWADYDNDGDLDLVLTGRQSPFSPPVTIFHDNLGGTFAARSFGLSGPPGSPTAVAGLQQASIDVYDYDSDGDLDVFLTGEVESPEPGALTDLFQNLATRNIPPRAPTGLAASVTAGGVQLTWEAGRDAEAADAGLTYNLRVGTTPGGIEVVTPLAQLPTGLRRLARAGNVGSGRMWRLENLPPGTYYWSVQSIDPGYAGSAFAPEGTFTIGGPPP